MSQSPNSPPLWIAPIGDNEVHIRSIVDWLNDPLVVRHSEQRRNVHTIKSQKEYLHEFRQAGNYYFGIFVGYKLVGSVTAYLDRHNMVANMGIMIGNRECWGKGHGLEVWNRMIAFLFSRDYRKVEAGCMANNSGMMSICKRAGMTEEGRQVGHFLFFGEAVDLVLWGKMNDKAGRGVSVW